MKQGTFLIFIAVVLFSCATTSPNSSKSQFTPNNIVSVNKDIFHLCNRTAFLYFNDFFKIKEYSNNVTSSGSLINDFEKSNQYNLMQHIFTVVSYIKASEELDKQFDVLKYFYTESQVELNKRISSNKSIIFYHKRDQRGAFLLLAAENITNLRLLYEFVSSKTELQEGFTEVNHY